MIADLYREVTTDRGSTVSLFQCKCSISKRTVHDEVLKSTGPKWCYNFSLYRNRTDLFEDGGGGLPPNKNVPFLYKKLIHMDFFDILEFFSNKSV